MKSWMTILLFVGTLFGVSIVNIVMPNQEKVSAVENRTLADKPVFSMEAFLSGSYMSDVEAFYGDHITARDQLITLSQQVQDLKGIQGEDQVEIFDNGTGDLYVTQDDKDSDTNQEGDKNSESLPWHEQVTDNKASLLTKMEDLNYDSLLMAKRELETYSELKVDDVLVKTEANIKRMEVDDDDNMQGEVQRNSFLVINDAVFELFHYVESSCAYYANAINGFAEKMGEGNRFYSIVAPSHIEFLKSKKYRDLAASQADAINYINSQFTDAIEPVNIYSKLAEHADEYIYFRSDHHWTQLGAYYAYTAFAPLIGDKPYELDRFETTQVEGFLGSLYALKLSAKAKAAVKANPDTVTIYKPFVQSDYVIHTAGGSTLNYDVINMGWAKKVNKYMVFISGDNPLGVIKTDVKNGRKILVFKDSYGNAFVPFLMSHYEEIHIIDPRKYKQGAVTYAKDHDIHEFLFLNSGIVIAGNTGFARHIYNISY